MYSHRVYPKEEVTLNATQSQAGSGATPDPCLRARPNKPREKDAMLSSLLPRFRFDDGSPSVYVRLRPEQVEFGANHYGRCEAPGRDGRRSHTVLSPAGYQPYPRCLYLWR